MQQDDVVALVNKTAELMVQFERRCADIEQHQQTQTEHLQHVIQQLPGITRQTAESALQTLPSLVLGNVKRGLEQPVAEYQQRLHESGTQVRNDMQTLAAQIQRMEQLQRHLVWKVSSVVLGSLLLLLVGGAWLSMHYIHVIEENQLSADLLKAYNAADVTLCDKGQLCANVDAKGQHYGDRKQYVPVIPR